MPTNCPSGCKKYCLLQAEGRFHVIMHGSRCVETWLWVRHRAMRHPGTPGESQEEQQITPSLVAQLKATPGLFLRNRLPCFVHCPCTYCCLRARFNAFNKQITQDGQHPHAQATDIYTSTYTHIHTWKNRCTNHLMCLPNTQHPNPPVRRLVGHHPKQATSHAHWA